MKTNPIFQTLCLAAVASGLLLTGCQWTNLTITDGYYFTKTGEIAESIEEGEFSEGINQIEIVNKFGNINIEAVVTSEIGESNTPTWSWEKRVWADTQELADSHLEDLLLEVKTEGQKQIWTIMMPESSSSFNGMESNFKMEIPVDVNVKLTNSHGNVDVANVKTIVDSNNQHGNSQFVNLSAKSTLRNSHGDLKATAIDESKVEVHHGNSIVDSTTGNLSINQSHGDADVANVDGTLDVDCTHGDVKVKHVQKSATIKTRHGDIEGNVSGDVEAGSSHGDVKLTTSGDKVKISTQHGEVDLKMQNESFEAIEITATFDDIKLYLPSASSPSIQMKATFGDSSSEFGSGENASLGDAQKVILNVQHGDIEVKKLK